VANSGIDLDVGHGEVHAMIGPNGAGKTTLIGQLSGETRPTSGKIVFDGVDVTALPPARRALLGLARTFQITSIFKSFSALENVAISAQAHCGHSYRFWAQADRDERLNGRAREALAAVGLDAQDDKAAMHMSHGEHRQLEIAMALVAAPKLMLLDEPTAGMGPEESQHIVRLLQRLKQRHAMLLIEHDMEVVFAIADRITVLVDGRVIACGTPGDIQADRAVRDAYLGEGAAASA
jgi:branched-chain amino acid transport system ATP-binding protein